MNMHAHLSRLFAYDDWANREVLAALAKAPAAPPKSLKLLAHIVAVEHLWFSRLLQDGEKVAVWPDLTLAQCSTQAVAMPALWQKYLESLTQEQLAQTVAYVNSKGESWTSARQDVLLHVVMHSAYHRGQIASDMRAAGQEPACTDFIQGVRQGEVRSRVV